MRNFAFHDDGRLVANVPVPEIDGEPPAHLYPQGELERYLEEALSSRGVEVEYDTAFISYEASGTSVRVGIRDEGQEVERTEEFDWVVGADGAHSAVRQAAGMPFVGRDYPETWSVAEISTRKWPSDAQAQLFLRSDGVGLFLSQPTSGVVQGILNAPNVSKALHAHFPDAELRYERDFRVTLRRVRSPRTGRVWLIGDAAHVQSPVGGQGLNLAIWDGITLAEGLLAGDLTVERVLARRARTVLLFTDFDYRMLATKSRLVRSVRNRYWAYAAKHPALARWFFKLISGGW